MAKVSNNKSWENIFDKFKLLNDIKKYGYVDISSDQIKSVDGKESRLMTKVDFRENLPTIMSAEKLSILAIKNGLYRIAPNDPFIDIQEKIETKIIEIEPPKNLLSIDPYNIKSESAALDISYISKMTNEVFNEETFLSIRGRLRGSLDFNIGTTPYNVNGVQIEVDGGYEGDNSINLIEAKIGYNNNINIRQLLYPELYWSKEIGHSKKNIRSFIFYLQEDLFRFIPYIYDGVKGYADHSNEKVFRFKDKKTKPFSLYDINVNENNIDQNIPFPQADRFDKINDMLIIISNTNSTCMDKEELQLHFDIVGRQIDYYFNVLKWLKLCTEIDNCIVLTDKGITILELPFKERIQEISKIVFSEPITNALLNNKNPTLQMFNKYNVNSQSTINRRSQTINAWIKYFKKIL